MNIRKIITGITLALGMMLSLFVVAPAAQANGYATRSVVAYDLTQVNCDWDMTQTHCYMGTAPYVHATTFYDTTITAKTYTYHNYNDINRFIMYNNRYVIASWAGTPIYTISSEGAYVLCWTTTTVSGENVQMDKMDAQLIVGGKQGPYIFYMPDQFVLNYVRDANHHC